MSDGIAIADSTDGDGTVVGEPGIMIDGGVDREGQDSLCQASLPGALDLDVRQSEGGDGFGCTARLSNGQTGSARASPRRSLAGSECARLVAGSCGRPRLVVLGDPELLLHVPLGNLGPDGPLAQPDRRQGRNDEKCQAEDDDQGRQSGPAGIAPAQRHNRSATLTRRA